MYIQHYSFVSLLSSSITINFIIIESSLSEVVTSTLEGHEVILEGACANETGLVILDILDVFAQKFGVIYGSC